jgi:hypothetical protein
VCGPLPAIMLECALYARMALRVVADEGPHALGDPPQVRVLLPEGVGLVVDVHVFEGVEACGARYVRVVVQPQEVC